MRKNTSNLYIIIMGFSLAMRGPKGALGVLNSPKNTPKL